MSHALHLADIQNLSIVKDFKQYDSSITVVGGMSGEFEVNEGTSGAAEYDFVQTSTLKKGSHVLIKGQPCKIDSISTSKPGKHGSAKCHIIAKNIFTQKKLEMISQAHAQEMAPIVTRTQYTLSCIEDGYLSMIDDDNEIRDDLAVPTGVLGEEIQEAYDNGSALLITTLSALGEDMVIAWALDKEL